MDKLTIKEKAKAYDEAIKRVENIKTDKCKTTFMFTEGLFEHIFPELKENEDRKIKKALIEHFAGAHSSMYPYKGFTKKQILAWLEKQGEQKPTDKVEPKFEIEEGKWYVCIRDLLDNYANKAFCKGDIYLSTQNGSLIPSNSNVPFEVVCPDTYFKDWTIQDAKDGDVLSWDDSKCIALFKNIYDEESFNSYGLVGHCTGTFELRQSYHDIEGAHPATKEQRDLLFQKMKEAGYEWDADKKELKKIEQAQTWSEEDEKIYNVVHDLTWEAYKTSRRLDIPTFGIINDWLKSIKDRVQRKQEWSEEDKAILEKCIGAVKVSCYSYSFKSEAENWLKSLRPQKKWEPSEEQMKVLNEVINFAADHGTMRWNDYIYNVLKSLREQIKNL